MGNRFMEVICMFDLPVVTARNRRAYRKFKKFLDDEGFSMLEESVYNRMVPSGCPLEAVKNAFKKNRPPQGLVILLTVTEKQFENMVFVTGEHQSDVISGPDPVVVI